MSDINVNKSETLTPDTFEISSIVATPTIDSYVLSPSKEELKHYDDTKKVHKQCKKWIEKFNKSNSLTDFINTTKNYNKSKLSSLVNIDFFFTNYVSKKSDDYQALANVMEYLAHSDNVDDDFTRGLCSIYNPNSVSKFFKAASYRRRCELSNYIELINLNSIEFSCHYYFDKTTHFYCEEIVGHEIGFSLPRSILRRYFASFDEFIVYRKGSLTNCNLSDLLDCTIDFKQYKIDKSTKLPPYDIYQEEYIVKKVYSNGYFHVLQQWNGPCNSILKEYHHIFHDFSAFITFLKGDLSEADLISYDGVLNIHDCNSINFTNVKLTSSQSSKIGLPYKRITQSANQLTTFKDIEHNEYETALVLNSHNRDISSENNNTPTSSFKIPVHYISDLHLSHLISNLKCKSIEDVIYYLRKVVEEITSSHPQLLLIAGDVASEFDTFRTFVKLLHQRTRRGTTVIFTLGNHELWDQKNLTLDETVLKYRTLLEEHGMYLLHNDILYAESPNKGTLSGAKWHLIPYSELSNLTDSQLNTRLKKARYVFFGGLGFSAYNPAFNASHGVYCNTIDYHDDLIETKKFESMHNRLVPILQTKNSVVVTHTPKECWSNNNNYPTNIIYVNGHTHRNLFYDDGEQRLYADNQCGYNSKRIRLKWFHLESTYDIFANYGDGIHAITREQYIEFYREINTPINFHRNFSTLYMLKKKGYYCFIAENFQGKLSILNGGNFSRLSFNDIRYYYDNMDKVISKIKSPLDKFSDYQKNISNIIKSIGGIGTIHGCIIDIDFHNHIFVNPFDGTLTAYWASDVVHKLVFPSTPALLKANHPKLYDNLVQLLNSTTEDVTLLAASSPEHEQPEWYLDTDIYRASRQIRKIQRLDYRILSTWFDETSQSKALPKPL